MDSETQEIGFGQMRLSIFKPFNSLQITIIFKAKDRLLS